MRSRSTRSARTRLRSVSKRRLSLHVRPWRAGDDVAFSPRADMAAEASSVAWSFPRYGPPGPTWTLVRTSDGAVLGMGGGVEQHRGDWQLWALLAPIRPRDWPAAIACAREVVRALVRDWRARRLTAVARHDFPGAQLVLQRLGFHFFGWSIYWPGYVLYERTARRRRAA